MKEVLEIAPSYADVLNNIGVVYQSLGMPDEADSYYKQFREINLDNFLVLI